MSNKARHRDIAALLARGVVRVKKQPLVAKAIESHMPSGKACPTDETLQDKSVRENEANDGKADSVAPIQQGGDQ